MLKPEPVSFGLHMPEARDTFSSVTGAAKHEQGQPQRDPLETAMTYFREALFLHNVEQLTEADFDAVFLRAKKIMQQQAMLDRTDVPGAEKAFGAKRTLGQLRWQQGVRNLLEVVRRLRHLRHTRSNKMDPPDRCLGRPDGLPGPTGPTGLD